MLIDLLVTDAGVPGGLNGRQVADAARIVWPDLNVLFNTDYAKNAVVGHDHLDHGMHVLTKPFTMEVWPPACESNGVMTDGADPSFSSRHQRR